MPKHHRALAVLAAAALAACGADGTQPSGVIATGGPLLELSDPPIEVSVLQRSTPLVHNFAAAAVIGPEGGTLRIPDAGFSITFPANAVAEPTEISVTAVPGYAVAYLFQPHGLVFATPAVITQELRGTRAPRDPSALRQLEGAYFTGPEELVGPTATVRETRPTLVDTDARKVTWTVEHFSGYTVSSTRRGGYINASGNLIPTGH
ncbi:MAG TPA: hypothetical protein VHG08_28015 [Longimicrobium sp.]|nr:hypothetical protein [Longimicrobium sp.]